MPQVPVMALTATATDLVQDNVIKVLGLRNCVTFKQSFNRTNLFYEGGLSCFLHLPCALIA